MNAPIPNHYDPQNAAALCQFSADAYESSHGSTESRPTVIDDEITDTRAVIYQGEKDMVVSFRGTQDLRNWLTDLDAALTARDGCKIHAGFWRALDGVFAGLNQTVFGPRHESRRIWLTGHSLGGALAMLYAWRNVNLFRSVPFAGLYTFGQPRVGNAAFRDSFPFRAGLNACAFRVVNAVDLVPHVPWLCGCYRHCGHEVYYESQISNLKFQIDRPLWLYALDDVMAMVSETVNPTSAEQWLADHHVSRYVALLSAPNLNLNPNPVLSSEGK
jgi:triacylglycerol lipase